MESLVTHLYTRNGRRPAFAPDLVVYNLGSGTQEYPGVIAIDKVQPADVVCDLNHVPWPIPSSSADVVLAFHLFEHLQDLNAAMHEVHRILKPGGRLIVEVPYYRSAGAFQDPTHVRFFTGATMGYFCRSAKRSSARYSTATFSLIRRWYGWPVRSANPLAESVKWFANTFSNTYDQFISLIFPVKIVVWELEVIK